MQAEVVVKVNRQNGYAGDFSKVQLVIPAAVKGIRADETTLASGKEVKLVIKAAADAAVGPRADLLLRATALFDGKVPIVHETKLSVTVAK